MIKSAFIQCNNEFIEIYTMSVCSVSHKDPNGDDFYFSFDEELKVLGNALISAISKSRDLSSSDEEIEYFTENCPPYPMEIWEDGSMETLNELTEKYKKWKEDHHQKWLKNKPERRLFEEDLERKRCSEWVDKMLNRYSYKNKKYLFRSMQLCSISEESREITLLPFGKGEARKGDFKFIIPSNSSPEVVGAAVKYAIARCRGKGADLVAKKLFPDGVPETFEKYLELLDLSI